MNIEDEPQLSRGRFKRAARLAVVCLLFGMVWGQLLPMIGQWTVVREWIDPLKAEGINPDGLYYTDVFTDNRHSKREVPKIARGN